MERNSRPRRRPEAPPVAPTTLHEITRRYYACAVALAKAMGVPMSETFLREHRESISCCFIEAGRAGVRLPAGVTLPPLVADARVASANGQPVEPVSQLVASPVNGDVPDIPPPMDLAPSNGHAPTPPVIATAADLPTRIPAGLQLPCAEALLSDLRLPQLALLIGKVGLRALADTSLEPLHVALLAERARRMAQGQRAEADANGA
jgi:hypothetical protein